MFEQNKSTTFRNKQMGNKKKQSSFSEQILESEQIADTQTGYFDSGAIQFSA